MIPALPGLSLTDFVVPAEDGSELYHFDQKGRHLRTLDALTGAPRFLFAYDGAGRLASITDGDGNVTTIERDGSGSPTGNSSAPTASGRRSKWTPMATCRHHQSRRRGRPAGRRRRRAARNAHRTGWRRASLRLRLPGAARARREPGRRRDHTRPRRGGTNYTVTLATALDRTTAYTVEQLPDGGERLTTVFPDGARTEAVQGTDGTETVTHADGSRVAFKRGPDPRWGMQAPLLETHTITTPGGRTHTRTTARTATLTDPTDPLSLEALTETVTVNGQATTLTYDAATRTLTGVTPAGRQSTFTLDARGRVVELHVGGFAPGSVAYDSRGRMSSVASGSGAATRSYGLAYHAAGPSAGLLATITDPMTRLVSLAYDSAGRLSQLTRADLRVFAFAHDADGHLVALTPPGQAAHAFTFGADNRIASYTPPALGADSMVVSFSYDLDGRRTSISRPDGQSIDVAYDDAGRIATLDLARGQVAYGYHPTTQQLTSIAAPGGLGLAYAYDGHLPISETWSGAVAGVVGTAYDDDFRVSSLSVNGNAVAYQYDPDDFLVSAGALTLDRDAQSGLLTATTLGDVTDARTYDGFGELETWSAAFSGAPLYAVAYTRDALGRIAQKTETIGGTTTIDAYAYDLAGRLVGVERDGASVASYTYDDNGNRTAFTGPGGTRTGTYDALDRLTAYGGTTYDHNLNGDLLSRTTAGGTTSYEYDALGNLTAVILSNGTRLDYLVDGRNRRVGRKVNGTLTTGWLYDGQQQVVAELDGANAVTSRFVYADGGLAPAYMVKGGASYRILTDHLGSVRLVVDAATGVDRAAPGLRRLRQRAGRHQPRLPALRLRRRSPRPRHEARPLRCARLRPRDRALDDPRPDPVRRRRWQPLRLRVERSGQPHRPLRPGRLWQVRRRRAEGGRRSREEDGGGRQPAEVAGGHRGHGREGHTRGSPEGHRRGGQELVPLPLRELRSARSRARARSRTRARRWRWRRWRWRRRLGRWGLRMRRPERQRSPSSPSAPEAGGAPVRRGPAAEVVAGAAALRSRRFPPRSSPSIPRPERSSVGSGSRGSDGARRVAWGAKAAPPHALRGSATARYFSTETLMPSTAAVSFTPRVVAFRVIDTPFAFFIVPMEPPPPTAAPALTAVYWPLKSSTDFRW